MTFSETVQAGTGTLSIGTKTIDMGGTLTAITERLLNIHLLNLLVQICNEHVHHCHDTTALLALLGVCIPSGRRRRRGILLLIVRNNLDKRDSCACNASWSSGRCQGAAHVQSNALLFRELTLWG